MGGKLKHAALILAMTLVPTVLLWLPFFLRLPSFWKIPLPQSGLATIVANYDGPLYLVAAKTFYNKAQIAANYQFPLPTEYYTAHFPLFPALIRLFSLITNYPYAMLFVTLASSFLAIFFFNKFISDFVSDKNRAMFLTFLFSVFPARWLIVRSVGSADPLFVAGVIASLYFFRKKKYWLAGIWGAVAQLTKAPGILLFISYATIAMLPLFSGKLTITNLKKYLPTLLIPLALTLVFGIYAVTTGDFFAYFKSGDNIHLFFPPFQIFNSTAPWVGTFWLEEVIFVYAIGAMAVYRLFKKEEIELGVFAAVFFILTLFISHRDLIRYSLPLVPLMFAAFSDLLLRKQFRFALMVIAIPIYLYSISFISQNVMPISNWAPFL